MKAPANPLVGGVPGMKCNEGIQTEDEKCQAEKDPCDENYYFHVRWLRCREG